jgi:hypothetical protein
MAWAVIRWNYKSPLYFCSYEGVGKGFTQKKYAEQILKGPLKELFEQLAIASSFVSRITASFRANLTPKVTEGSVTEFE